MSKRAIIREGDTTSHGGIVLEAFPNFTVYGKNAAGVGHRGHCPQCKRDFVIVAGAAKYTFMGKNVAVEGMQTSCGAVLIASQGQATVDDSSGATTSIRAGANALAAAVTTSTENEDHEYFYTVERDDGSPVKLAYRIDNGDEKLHEGELCGEGKTTAFPMNKSGEPTFWIPMI